MAVTEEWQEEVYRDAAKFAHEHGCRHVLDVGCGNASKLLKYFPDIQTVGCEVEPTITWLRKTYPEKLWLEPELCSGPFDMMVCADVIEHVDDPDELMRMLLAAEPKYLFISTPDPSMMGLRTEDGPPKNLHHVREWNFDQFRAYLDTWVRVEAHYISNAAQYTQVAVCVPRA